MSEAADREPLKLEIRPLERRHLNRVMEIESRSFPTPWSRNAFESELATNTYARYFTAWLGRILVGYVGMWVILDEAHITTIAVDPDYRGQRFGSQLLEKVRTEAIAQGAKRITLEVRRSNEIAKRLYLGHGYEIKGIRRGYYRDNDEDAIIMWKELSTPGPD